MKGTDFFARIATAPGAAALHPRLAVALRDYLAGEKAVAFGRQWVLNTHFPPFPSRAFETLVAQFADTSGKQRLYSVTIAVTNRCPFNCWHCYNAGRDQHDVPLAAYRELAGNLQRLGAVMIDLTGGEPLLRPDLEQICAAFDSRSCVILGTTGWGLTAGRAAALRDSGVFGMGISLDSAVEEEHDRLRGKAGAFRAALRALTLAADAGIYPYVVAVATREFLEPARFEAYMRFARDVGAREVHLLEPCPTGRLAGRRDVVLTAAERARLVACQHAVAAREDLPILSTFTYLEGPDAFGCGAGLTHMYVDGSGDLCPCNLVPASFGNITREPLEAILARMHRHFRQPRPACIGRLLTPRIKTDALPTPPDVSEALCEACLPKEHALPRFFRVREEVRQAAHATGAAELAHAYNSVHRDYDDFWTVQAGRPAQNLVERLSLRGSERVFEAGCGSGVATVALAGRLRAGGSVLAVDISEGMQRMARQRLAAAGGGNVTFVCGDALQALREQRDLDLVFSSWVLGYVPVTPFLSAAAAALRPGGHLAFLVHTENSPRREFGIFRDIVAENPAALLRPVDFGFPRGEAHVRAELQAAHLTPRDVWEGAVVFRYRTVDEVLEHLLKSGAGTVFYDAVDPQRRDELTREFLARLGFGHLLVVS